MNRTIHVVGHGVVARRTARLLKRRAVISHDPHWALVTGVSRGDVAVLAHGGAQAHRAASLIERGVHVVTLGSDVADTKRLLRLAGLAADQGVSLVVGAAVSPGLSGLIARQVVSDFATVDELHIAVHGTAGPACAREYHRSLSGRVEAWHNGEARVYMGGSGRDLNWFPEPIGARDCYRAASSEPMLLQRVFPTADRISHRRSARRRDRFTGRLPMLAPPPAEGAIGGLRVEVRGSDQHGGRITVVNGIAELIGSAAAATAASFVVNIAEGAIRPGLVIPGSDQLPNLRLLRTLTGFGIRLQTFTGVPQA